MSSKSIPLILLFAVLFTAPGCGDSASKQEPNPETSIEGSIPINVGQTFQIKLPANPTGGYGWTYRTELEKNHLKEVKRAFQELPAPQANSDITGYETWAFTALEKGTTTIELVYKQHWREDGPPAKTYFAHVIIS